MDHKSAPYPPSVRRDARVERSRTAFRQALLSLLEANSYDAITIREITARAGAGYATFFRHYPDKDALLNDLAAAEIRELLSRSLPIALAADSHGSCVALCRYVNEHRKLWTALLTGGAAGAMRVEFVRQARLAVPEGVEQVGSLPTDLRCVFGVAGTVEILAWWLREHGDESIERVAEILDRLVVAPAMAD
jgi:AcrR family transcriptional regulator